MRLLPGVTICDITHEISHFNLLEAAFVAKSACLKFPKGSVHLIGVDPEGGSRQPIMIMVLADHYFVAPDNGVLSLIKESMEAECYVANVDNIELSSTGRAFLVQNRMAQIAAALASGQTPAELGTEGSIKDYRWGEPSLTENSLRGVILHIDHFGNALTNIRKEPFMEVKGEKSFQVFIRNLRLQRIVGSYGDVSKGEALAIFSDCRSRATRACCCTCL